MTKKLNKLGMEGMYHNIIKAMYDKFTASIILSDERLKAFPLRSRQDKVSTLTTPNLTQYESSSLSN